MIASARPSALLLASLLALPPVAAAQSAGAPASTSMSYLAGTCTNCHGTQGRSPGAMPSLAGMPQATLVEQMRQFRDGKRPATIMHQIAKGYTEPQTDLLADYFARQSLAR